MAALFLTSKISFSFLDDCSSWILWISLSSISIGYFLRYGSKSNPVFSLMIFFLSFIISSNILLIFGGRFLFNRLRISSPSRSTFCMAFSNSSSISFFKELTSSSMSTSLLSITLSSSIIGIISPKIVSWPLIFCIS